MKDQQMTLNEKIKEINSDFREMRESNGVKMVWLEKHGRFGVSIDVWIEQRLIQLLSLIQQERKEAVREFVDSILESMKEDKRYWVCPKCNYKKEYFSKHDPVYCEDDGRKMVLQTIREFKGWDINVYDLEEKAKGYLSSNEKEVSE